MHDKRCPGVVGREMHDNERCMLDSNAQLPPPTPTSIRAAAPVLLPPRAHDLVRSRQLGLQRRQAARASKGDQHPAPSLPLHPPPCEHCAHSVRGRPAQETPASLHRRRLHPCTGDARIPAQETPASLHAPGPRPAGGTGWKPAGPPWPASRQLPPWQLPWQPPPPPAAAPPAAAASAALSAQPC